VKRQGAGFGIAKASEGTADVDDQFASNWKTMRSAGIPVRGAYHFGHPGESATAQAAHFASVVGVLSVGEFLVLDIESATTRLASNWTIEAENAVATWCVDFVNAVMAKTGLRNSRVWVYTGENPLRAPLFAATRPAIRVFVLCLFSPTFRRLVLESQGRR